LVALVGKKIRLIFRTLLIFIRFEAIGGVGVNFGTLRKSIHL
jgi:hypothetical protein